MNKKIRNFAIKTLLLLSLFLHYTMHWLKSFKLKKEK